MTALAPRRLFATVISEPISLVASQPHQILLSAGSVALMGQFAATDGIVDPVVGYVIAIGVEWAYLRGLASDSRAQTRWGGILNWSAFGIVVLWGVLWCAGLLHAYDPRAGGWPLAAAHVVPVAWLSLCSAQCHRAAMQAEARAAEQRAQIAREREARLQDERDVLQLELEREWRRAQLAADVRALRASARATSAPAANTSGASVDAPASASGTPTNTGREHLREQVARTLREQPAANKAALARQLGIGRTLLYDLIAEARSRGELPPV